MSVQDLGTSSKNCVGRTVLFLTTEKTDLGGICSNDGQGVWGDMVIVYGSNLHHSHTYPHELGHSFGLPHTFSSSKLLNPYHQFHWGYTENYMDYGSTKDGKVINPFHKKVNPVFTFHKCQWDIMRNDKSLRRS